MSNFLEITSYYSVFHNFISPLIFLEIMVFLKIESHPFYPLIVTDLTCDEAKKKIKMSDSKKLSFSIPPILNIFFQKFHGLVLGLVGLIDAKGIDVAQPIWS